MTKGNWAIADGEGKIIKRGFRYKPTAISFLEECKVHKRENLQVVKDD